ncbi:MAG: hypothetical protein BGO82_18770 [Devosia sp. 67-54]|uniref:BrnT family toxin n=1 Tax=unclassified Devosia TaxID=196773 RepID=UPI00095C96A8|nr:MULTISPECIES: BrnT family toxin [unclassified Devosia]MBN9304420.1 BrnT family toxin [Devosia sp.]OJX18219.1 MAG: hypothetical protein BGO82_18770 [Devosia sp. 67-54]
MEFEWDEEKRTEVIRIRGVDFVLATQVFKDVDRIEEVDNHKDYGEVRHRTLGWVGSNRLMVVYTMRGEVCRIITAWKVESR